MTYLSGKEFYPFTLNKNFNILSEIRRNSHCNHRKIKETSDIFFSKHVEIRGHQLNSKIIIYTYNFLLNIVFDFKIGCK